MSTNDEGLGTATPAAAKARPEHDDTPIEVPAADILSAITTRTSYGLLALPAPTENDLLRMVAAAMAAPDHGRLRPWRFVVFQGDALHDFAEMMAGSLRRKDPDASEERQNAERRKATRAPMIVVVVVPSQKTAMIPRVEQLLSGAAAAQNFLLAVHALGFGGMWRTGPMAYDATAKGELGLNAEDDIVAFLYLGTPPAPPRPRSVNPADALVHWRAKQK